MKRNAGAPEVGPLRHGLEVIDRLGRFHLDRAKQFVALIRRRQYEIRENLHRSDSDRHGLLLPHVDRDVRAALQTHLKQADHAVMFELFPNGSHQDRTHVTSRRRKMAAAV
jgi:hypothetical protein